MALYGILITKVGSELDAPHIGVWLRDYDERRRAGWDLKLFRYWFDDMRLHKEAANRFFELPPVVCMFDTDRGLVTSLQVGDEARKAWAPEIESLPVNNPV